MTVVANSVLICGSSRSPGVEDTFFDLSQRRIDRFIVQSKRGNEGGDIEAFGFGKSVSSSFVRRRRAFPGVLAAPRWCGHRSVGAIASAPPVTTAPKRRRSLALTRLQRGLGGVGQIARIG